MTAGPPRPGPECPPIDAARLGMLIFLGAELMLFAGFMAAWIVFRMSAAAWPPPGQPRLPFAVTVPNLLVLLASGFTMRSAAAAARRADRGATLRGLAMTGLLGILFLAVQGAEWVRLLRFGVGGSPGISGAIFYTLIGAHAVHLLAALLALAIVIAAAVLHASPPPETRVGVLAMFWWFVVALWPILFLVLYVD